MKVGNEAVARDAAVIGVFDTHPAAGRALGELARAGLPRAQVSLVGMDHPTDAHLVALCDTEGETRFWGRLGAFWGSVASRLDGRMLAVLPGIGPVFVFGPLCGWVLGALEGGAVLGGGSALAAGLGRLGVPRAPVATCEAALRAGRFLVVVAGAIPDVERAAEVLRLAAPTDLRVHRRAIAAV